MATPDSTPIKVCSKCGNPYPSSPEFFNRDRNRKDGLFPWCKNCSRPHGVKMYRNKQTPAQREHRELYLELAAKGLRQCIKCGNILPATADFFSIKPQNKTLLKSECKQCELKALRRWEKEHPDSARKASQLYRLKHRERLTASKRQWRHSHLERSRKQHREWIAAHPEVARASNHRRRARKHKAEGNYTMNDIHALYASSKGRCWWCGKKVGDNYHIDHRIPLARGGTNWPDNLCISCPECNQSKSDKMPWEWSDRLL